MEHPVFANLPPAQQDALTKLMSLLGPEGVAHLASQGPEAVTARLESFSLYKNALLEHVQEKMSAATAAASMTREESMRLEPLMVSVKTFEGKDGENHLLWTREAEMVMGSALLQSEHQRGALAIFRFGGRAHEWALTCGTSVDAAFPTWDQLKQQLSRVLAPPNQAYQAVDVALNAEHNFRSARPDWSAGSASSASGSEPMDLSYAEDEEAELLAAEQRAGIRRCRRRRYFECNSTKHLRAYCPLRKKREAPVS
ncbi:hypothetical protein PInf_008184 [Phytophthora infestans]|nr:hypothetical protein PInf_008184 [Phytophthora infestans]